MSVKRWSAGGVERSSPAAVVSSLTSMCSLASQGVISPSLRSSARRARTQLPTAASVAEDCFSMESGERPFARSRRMADSLALRL